ncbi:sensor domain-containing protein [Noviherbaspirillum galbum]|uniref:EAL domain-containing protein n=1 Tax=Noviherbaspirillum galbum TaxID=2709383 RepID=A0A6B3SNE2_9BURK|nr:bifunctional diguanylate cyclase/phosphodiesterase [Noviherbaspirillum galbum]NEX62227.1 EAL domain-containing protein [Noviherbaspirillum galbum]
MTSTLQSNKPGLFLQQIVDSSATMFWMTDAEGTCIYLTQVKTATPEQRAEFVMRNWVDLIHEEDRVLLGPLVKKCWDAREAYQVRYRLRRSDGAYRWVMGAATPRIGGDGKFEGYIGSVVDVTDQSTTFRSTRIEFAHQLAASNSTDIITHHAPDSGNYLYASASVKKSLGYEPYELVGKSAYQYIHPEDIPNIREEVERQMRGNPPEVLEHRVRHASGDYIWVSSSITVLIDPLNGTKLGAVVISRDVTRERQAREELMLSEARLRSLMNLSSDWYWETDHEGRFTYFSDGLYRLLGALPSEVLGKTRRERAADPNQPGLAAYEQRCAARLPFRDILYSSYGDSKTRVRHSAISGEPVFADGVFLGYRGVGRDITSEIDVARQLEYLAMHDVLTGLPNRASLFERLQNMLSTRGDDTVGVLFIDLDRFKEINDAMGHVPGDLLLREVARRLEKTLADAGIVARLGGDEFVVCVRGSVDRPGLAALAQKLLDAMAQPIVIQDQEVRIRASIGICLCPEDGATRELLFQNADIAMYQAKAEGRNAFRFFEPEMSVRMKTRMAFETSMPRALENREFELHYQPRIDLRTMEVLGMEALIRWNHPRMGRISPLDFIPFAEERGYIKDIGRWVLEEACLQARRLGELSGKPLRVSVNLSARQLDQSTLGADIRHILAQSALPPDLLELELTESALVKDMDATVATFRSLKSQGIRIAVDDFGTGYSGLAYLGHFPLDTLKLDKSFVNQPGGENHKVIKAFIDMAHSLGLSVVAEGVERAETLAFLHAMHCDEAQGYLLAKPMPVADLEDFLRNWQPPKSTQP